MKPIILVEFTPAIGHRVLFNNTYRLLKKGFDVTCFCPKGYDEQDVNFKYNSLSVGYPIKTKRYLEYLWDEIVSTRRNIKQVIQYAKKNNISDIVCLTYGDFGLFFSQLLIPNGINLYIMHHANIDSICRSRIKRFMFSTYKSRFRHIVLCKFIGDHLKNYIGVNASKILVWPHPLNLVPTPQKEAIYDCVGLSNSNDEMIINQIIELEKQTEVLKKNNLHVVLKSSHNRFDNGYLQVFNGFIDKPIFDNYINKARCLLMPFPDSFQLRISGTLMDALSNNKILLGTNIPITKYSKKTYPNIVQVLDVNTFASTILGFKIKNSKLEMEFALFKYNHSDEYLAPLMINSLTKNRQVNFDQEKYDF